MAWILIIISAISLWLISLWRVLSSNSCVPSNPPFLSTRPGKRRNVLLVVAHPDDESMFFTPTILFLKSEGHNLHILCMSIGDADGMGNIRKEELYRACAILKVPLDQVQVLDHPNLQDGFDKRWDHQLLAGLIEEQIKIWDIDSVITFDNFGVSGHGNHRDVHHAISDMKRYRRILKPGNLSVQVFFASIAAQWKSGYLYYALYHTQDRRYIAYQTAIHTEAIRPWLDMRANGFGSSECLLEGGPNASLIAVDVHELNEIRSFRAHVKSTSSDYHVDSVYGNLFYEGEIRGNCATPMPS